MSLVRGSLRARLALGTGVVRVVSSGCSAGDGPGGEPELPSFDDVTDVGEYVAGLDGVDTAEGLVPPVDQDDAPALTLSLAPNASVDQVESALRVSIDGLVATYDESADLRVELDDERGLDASTAQEPDPATLARALTAARDVEFLEVWSMDAVGRVTVAPDQPAQVTSRDYERVLGADGAVDRAEEVLADPDSTGVPAWVFPASGSSPVSAVFATDGPLSEATLGQWRAVLAADDRLRGVRLTDILLAPPDLPGYEVGDAVDLEDGSLRLSVRFELEPAVVLPEMTPKRFGDRLAPMVEALWSVVEGAGAQSYLALGHEGPVGRGRYAGYNTDPLFTLALPGEPLGPGDSGATDPVPGDAWEEWAEELLA